MEFRFCAIPKTWSIASLISMYGDEMADDRNQVDAKIDPRLACFFFFFFKTPGVPFFPHVPFCPDLLSINGYSPSVAIKKGQDYVYVK